MKTHSCWHPLSRKNPGRDCRKPQKPEIWLGRCRNWFETLENPADRWWSVCVEKRVRCWLVIALAVENLTVRAQTATHWGETKVGGFNARTTRLFLFQRLWYSFDDLSACIHLLPSSKAACGCLLAQSGRVIDVWWDGSSISWQGGGLDADYTLICSEERSCVIFQSSFVCLRTRDYGFFFSAWAIVSFMVSLKGGIVKSAYLIWGTQAQKFWSASYGCTTWINHKC